VQQEFGTLGSPHPSFISAAAVTCSVNVESPESAR